MERHIPRGVTLVELLTVIAILALLITLGVPALEHFLQKNRLRAAAEGLLGTLHQARAESLVRPDPGQRLHVSFHRHAQQPEDWCFGLRRGSPCDCRVDDTRDGMACVLEVAGEAVLRTVSSRDYPGVHLDSIAFGGHDHTLFSPERGTARAGHVSFRLRHELRVVLSALGRARLCSPREAYLPGYPPC